MEAWNGGWIGGQRDRLDMAGVKVEEDGSSTSMHEVGDKSVRSDILLVCLDKGLLHQSRRSRQRHLSPKENAVLQGDAQGTTVEALYSP